MSRNARGAKPLPASSSVSAFPGRRESRLESSRNTTKKRGEFRDDKTATRGVHAAHGAELRRDTSGGARSDALERYRISLPAGLGFLLPDRLQPTRSRARRRAVAE